MIGARFWCGLALTWTIVSASLSCSVPSLEDPRCAEAQDSVKRFYSLHFDRKASETESAAAERPFLTDRLATELATRGTVDGDYFTVPDSFPRAFRVGTCKLGSEQNAEVSVLLLWRSDEKSEQREIRVQTTNANGSWLIDRVSRP